MSDGGYTLMQSKKLGKKVYLRVDKDEDILNSILKVCQDHDIKSATFSGLGACDQVTVGTYIPSKNDFAMHKKAGMLEMINLTGNVTYDTKDQKRQIHAHGLFSYLDSSKNQIKYFGGDLKQAQVMYTGEITIEPVYDGILTKKYDPRTGISIWNL